jgi:hypothetical protein
MVTLAEPEHHAESWVDLLEATIAEGYVTAIESDVE